MAALTPATTLTIALAHPRMSSVLRAGLGGLAASLQAFERDGISIPGSWKVHPHKVVLDWSSSSPETFFDALFQASFRLQDGVIDLPGAVGRVRPRLEVRSALQNALRRTFLQHGKTARKEGSPVARTFELDERQHTVQVQSYSWFVHQDQGPSIGAAAASGGNVELAGWANPGAVQRHVAYGATKMRYEAPLALCACFALVGCLSLSTPGGGVLVIPEPFDLLDFARIRPRLTPSALQQTMVGGVGDAALGAEAALLSDRVEGRRGVGRVSAVLLQSTPWASQQKSRVDVLRSNTHSEEALSLYRSLVSLLPGRVVAVAAKKDKPGDVFVVPSSLRVFAANNLARDQPWYLGFADARDLRDRQRFLHQRWEPDNLGALLLDEVNGVRLMSEHLEEAERLLVCSVQRAIRHRFGAIAGENQHNVAARKKRTTRESERWRMAFAGAKTREQLRFSLADLWSRAGRIPELAEGWEQIMPLVNRDWQAARDLALVALAAYASAPREADANDSDTVPRP